MHELGICDALRKMVSRIAAQEGATVVRVGSAIFGPRSAAPRA